MSGIRSTSTVPPVTGATPTSASGAEQVAPVSPPTPTGQQAGSAPSKAPVPPIEPQPNTVVQAVVTAKAGEGNVILHTELGNFRLTTQIPLAIGSQVTFEIDTVEDITLVHLTSVNGKALKPPVATQLLPVINQLASGTEGYVRAGQLHPLEMQSGFQNLAATVGDKSYKVTPAILPSAHTNPSQPAPVETARSTIATGLTAPTSQAQIPAPVVNPSASPRPSPYVASTISPPASPLPSPYAALDSSIISGMSVPAAKSAEALQAHLARFHVVEAEFLRPNPEVNAAHLPGRTSIAKGEIVSLIVQPKNSPNLASPQRPDIFQGKIIAVTAPQSEGGRQQVHVSSPLGGFSYKTATPPQVGATVQIAAADKVTVFPLPYADIQQPGPREPLARIMGDWQNLRQALNVVANLEPAIAQSVLSNIIPQANGQLSGSLLFFMTALQLGSVEKWLGQDFKAALRDAGRPSLMQALDEDFKNLGRMQAEPGGQDWKSLNFPLFDGANLRQIRLFYQQQKARDGSDEEKDGTRFIIELNLTKTGPIQLDGLFMPKQFDLVLRSQADIAEKMKHQILSIFTENMEISGLSGQIVFKTTTPFPVDPLAEWETDLAESSP